MAISPQSVSAVTRSIKSLLESHFCQVSVEGELSNLSLQPSGHLYFGIKDHQAFLHGAFFHFRNRGACRLPKDGDRVIIHGKLAVYAPKGQYQLVAHSLHYAGEGDLLQQLEALKRRLSAEGYFNPERKRPLPKAPHTIGVISSPTGAVIQDILRILSRRCHQFRVLLYPTTVQGSSAATEISQAVTVFNQERLADVLIIARGGGSFEDLYPFNDERLVKAIASSTIPIISAVGHETDYTLCDFAADLRAPTPSAAAELVCKSDEHYLQELTTVLASLKRQAHLLLLKKQETLRHWKRFFSRADFYRPVQQSLDYLHLALQRAMQTKLRLYQQRYEQLSHYILSLNTIPAAHRHLATLRHMLTKTLQSHCTTNWQQIVSNMNLVQHAIYQQFLHFSSRLIALHEKLKMQILHQWRQEKKRLHALQECLASLNPKKILERGYAMLFDFNNGSTIISSRDLEEHRCIRVVLQDGEVSFTVKDVKVLKIEGH